MFAVEIVGLASGDVMEGRERRERQVQMSVPESSLHQIHTRSKTLSMFIWSRDSESSCK